MAEWQNGFDSLIDMMEAINADGIDFVPLTFGTGYGNQEIYKSYTKEEFVKTTWYPKSNYKFWKIFNGEKFYIDFKKADSSLHKTKVISI